MLKKAVIALSAFVFLLLILIGLVMGAVLEITRQTGLKNENGAAVMRSKSGDVVATASSEQTVNPDGSMTVKASGTPGTPTSNRRANHPRCGGSGVDHDSGSGSGAALAASRRKWGLHGPPSRRELIMQYHGRRSSAGDMPAGLENEKDAGSDAGEGMWEPGSGGPDPFCDPVMHEDPMVEIAVNKKTMNVTAQLTDTQLKKVDTLTIGQGESQMAAKVYGFLRLQCEDELCEMKAMDGTFIQFDTSVGKIDINGHGEVRLPPEEHGGIRSRSLHAGGFKTSENHAGVRRILAKSRRSGHPQDGMPSVTVDVESVDRNMASQSAVHGIGIKPVDPPQTYHVKTVDYVAGDETVEECINRLKIPENVPKRHVCPKGVQPPDVCQDFLGQEGITVNLCEHKLNAGGYLMKPTGVTETIRIFMEMPSNATGAGNPEENGIFTIQTQWDAMYPDQKKYKMVKPNGDAFEAQAVKNQRNETQLFHGKFTKGAETGPMGMAMPTAIEPRKTFTKADDIQRNLPTIKQVEEQNRFAKKIGRRMLPVYVTQKEMETRAAKRRRRAGEPLMTSCPQNALGTCDVQEGCFCPTHMGPDGKDKLPKNPGMAFATGHTDVSAPTGDGKHKMSVRTFVIQTPSGKDIHTAETEPCTYDDKGKCILVKTGKGVPYMVEDPSNGNMKIIAQAKPLARPDTAKARRAGCRDSTQCAQKAAGEVMPGRFKNDPFKPFDFDYIDRKVKQAAGKPAPPLMTPGQKEEMPVDTAVVGMDIGSVKPAKKVMKIGQQHESRLQKPASCPTGSNWKCDERALSEGPIKFKMESFCDCTGEAGKPDEYEMVKSVETLDLDGVSFTAELDRRDHNHTKGTAGVRAHVKRQGAGSRALLVATGGHKAPMSAAFLPEEVKAAMRKQSKAATGDDPAGPVKSPDTAEAMGTLMVKGEVSEPEINRNKKAPKGHVPEPALKAKATKVLKSKKGQMEFKEAPESKPVDAPVPTPLPAGVVCVPTAEQPCPDPDMKPVDPDDVNEMEGTEQTITFRTEATTECEDKKLVMKLKAVVDTETCEMVLLSKVRPKMQTSTQCTMVPPDPQDKPEGPPLPGMDGPSGGATQGAMCEKESLDTSKEECLKVGCCQYDHERGKCWPMSSDRTDMCDRRDIPVFSIKTKDEAVPPGDDPFAEGGLRRRLLGALDESFHGADVFPGSRRNLEDKNQRPDGGDLEAYQKKVAKDMQHLPDAMKEFCMQVDEIGEEVRIALRT